MSFLVPQLSRRLCVRAFIEWVLISGSEGAATWVMSSSSKNWGNLKSGKSAISLSDSDEGDIGEKHLENDVLGVLVFQKQTLFRVRASVLLLYNRIIHVSILPSKLGCEARQRNAIVITRFFVVGLHHG